MLSGAQRPAGHWSGFALVSCNSRRSASTLADLTFFGQISSVFSRFCPSGYRLTRRRVFSGKVEITLCGTSAAPMPVITQPSMA